MAEDSQRAGRKGIPVDVVLRLLVLGFSESRGSSRPCLSCEAAGLIPQQAIDADGAELLSLCTRLQIVSPEQSPVPHRDWKEEHLSAVDNCQPIARADGESDSNAAATDSGRKTDAKRPPLQTQE